MEAYTALLLLLALAVLGVGAGYAVALLVAPAGRPRRRDPFLSGGAPREQHSGRVHARWYPVTLLFLAFDMEMVFMYPWAVVFAEVGVKALMEMAIFLFVLGLGVLYAWREGALRWT